MAIKSKLKIFGVPWHVAHQYDLAMALQDIADYYLLINPVRKWSEFARPIPKNVHFVNYFEKNKYDLAILHVDQQCVNPFLGKSKLYRQINSIVSGVPKIVINHGTPWYPELWDNEGWKLPPQLQGASKEEIFEYQKDIIINGGKIVCKEDLIEVEGMRNLIGKNIMVVNSHTAREQWGWGETIIHGMGIDEWWDLPKEPVVITMISPAGLDYYYNRELLKSVKTKLAEVGIKHYWITYDWTIDMHKNLTGWDAYRDFLGRGLVYFNPTKESPMPRSRTEAMLSGSCVITTLYQDADSFIKDGENGFLVPENPDFIVRLIQKLIDENYRLAVEIGQNGKATAQKLFNRERYKKDWLKLINKIL